MQEHAAVLAELCVWETASWTGPSLNLLSNVESACAIYNDLTWFPSICHGLTSGQLAEFINYSGPLPCWWMHFYHRGQLSCGSQSVEVWRIALPWVRWTILARNFPTLWSHHPVSGSCACRSNNTRWENVVPNLPWRLWKRFQVFIRRWLLSCYFLLLVPKYWNAQEERWNSAWHQWLRSNLLVLVRAWEFDSWADHCEL